MKTLHCPRCGGFLYDDDGDLLCINCSRGFIWSGAGLESAVSPGRAALTRELARLPRARPNRRFTEPGLAYRRRDAAPGWRG